MNKHPKQDLLNLYHKSFQASAQYAYILDRDGHLLDCNKNLMKVLGCDSLDTHAVGAIYKLMLDKQFGNEQQLMTLKETDIDKLVGHDTEVHENRMPLLINKKTSLQFKVTRTPLFNDKQEQTGMLVCLQDITREVVLEEQFAKVKAQLARENAKIGESGSYSSTLLFSGIEDDDMHSPRVLLVEDDPGAQKAAKSVLLSCNFEVHIASNEKEFNKLFKPGKFNLVLLDIGLEETSGYMIAKAIRKKEKNTEFRVPIVAVTGYDPKNLSGDCAHYSIEGAIQKPLSISQAAQMNQRYIKNIDIDVTGLEPARPYM